MIAFSENSYMVSGPALESGVEPRMLISVGEPTESTVEKIVANWLKSMEGAKGVHVHACAPVELPGGGAGYEAAYTFDTPKDTIYCRIRFALLDDKLHMATFFAGHMAEGRLLLSPIDALARWRPAETFVWPEG